MANVDIKLGYKDSAWFTANPTLILKQGQIVALEQTGTYKLGDGVTQLSALTFLGSSGGGSWGSITGTLSNQTDLQNALNTKEDTSNKSIDIDTDQASNTKYPSVKAIYDWVVGLFVKKGTLTTNYIPKATASDTIGDGSIYDDGTNVGIGTASPTVKLHFVGQQSKFDYTLDGIFSGTPNMTYSTSTGGMLFNIYYQSGGGYMTKYFSNGTVLSMTTESAGYYTNYVSSRYDVANMADNKLKLSVHMSNGFTAIGNDYFVPNERVEIRDGSLRINDLTPSQIVETDASKNLVSAAKGTAYNKDFGTTAGTVLEGDRITQTITNGVTDKAPSEDAVFDALLNFNDRNLSLRKTQDSATITGTTSETILESILIPANTFSVDDVINLECRIRRVSPTGSTSHRIRVNTSNSLSGATLVGIVTNSNTVLMPSFNRNLLIKSSSNTEVMNTSATFSFDIGSITSAASSINIDWATDKYLIISVQPSVNTESNTLSYLLIETK